MPRKKPEPKPTELKFQSLAKEGLAAVQQQRRARKARARSQNNTTKKGHGRQ